MNLEEFKEVETTKEKFEPINNKEFTDFDKSMEKGIKKEMQVIAENIILLKYWSFSGLYYIGRKFLL